MPSYFEKREFTREKPLDAWWAGAFSFRAHWQQDVELMYVLEGVQGVSVDNRYEVLAAGDLAFCRPRAVHFYDATPGVGRIVLAIADTSFLRDHAGWSDRFALSTPFLHLPQLADAFRTLADEGESQGPHHVVAMKSALLSIFTTILRSPYVAEKPEGEPEGPGATMALVQRALAHLEVHFAEDVTHESMAALLAISPSYYSRVFHRATGMGFREYLNHLRVERAMEMLADPRLTVTDIAFACGFGSLRTFHRAFRDVTGTTPLRRRAARG